MNERAFSIVNIQRPYGTSFLIKSCSVMQSALRGSSYHNPHRIQRAAADNTAFPSPWENCWTGDTEQEHPGSHLLGCIRRAWLQQPGSKIQAPNFTKTHKLNALLPCLWRIKTLSVQQDVQEPRQEKALYAMCQHPHGTSLMVLLQPFVEREGVKTQEGNIFMLLTDFSPYQCTGLPQVTAEDQGYIGCERTRLAAGTTHPCCCFMVHSVTGGQGTWTLSQQA